MMMMKKMMMRMKKKMKKNKSIKSLDSQNKENLAAKYSKLGNLKVAISDEKIAEMRIYWKQIRSEKHYPTKKQFYEDVANKFGVSYGTAYKYCKNIV